MPTGFTKFIEDGKVTNGKDFLKLCLRNFGVLEHLKDKPLDPNIPEKISNEALIDYLKGEVNKYETLKSGLENFDKKQWFEQQQRDIKSYSDKSKELKAKFKADTTAYDKIKAEIEAWKNDEEFKDIKDFALNQIEISYPKPFDYDEDISKLKKMSTEEFKNKRLSEVEEMITAGKKRIEDTEKVIADRQAFLDRFLADVEK